MEGFDTICLDSNICDICNQDTGEELISCILNDRCLQVGETSAVNDETQPYKQAHKDCLARWKSVVQSTLNSKCPSPKRSWKDKLKDLINRNVESTSIFDAWVEVDSSKSSTTTQISSNEINPTCHAKSSASSTRTNSFLTKEEYRFERVNGDMEECLERGRKLRVRSVDIEEEDEELESIIVNHGTKQDEQKTSKYFTWSEEKLRGLKHKELLDIYNDLNRRIEETSSLLVSELEEKDSLRQQYDSLNTTVAQLVQLQQKHNVKTFSLDCEHHQHIAT